MSLPQTGAAAARLGRPSFDASFFAPRLESPVHEQAFVAMVQREVELVMRDGTIVTGTLAGHDAKTVTVIARSGVVAVHAKANVLVLQVPQPAPAVEPAPAAAPAPAPAVVVATPAPAEIFAPAPRMDDEPKRGIGLVVSGAVLTGVGSIFLLSGAGLLAVDGGAEVWAPLLVVGLLHVGAGVPLMAVGTSRNRTHRAWRERHAFALAPTPTQGMRGVSASMSLRF